MTYLNLPKRSYSQYENSPKLQAWLKIARIFAEELAKAASDVRGCLDIDTATGETLSIISRIVVVDRFYVNQLLGAAVVAEKKSGSSLTDRGTQLGKPKDATEPMVSEWATIKKGRLDDEVLRTICRAKIAKNSATPTHDGILDAFNFTFPYLKAGRLIDGHDMSFQIEYRGHIQPREAFLLSFEDLIPVPQGVRFAGFLPKTTEIEFVQAEKDMEQYGNQQLEFL